MEKILTVIIPTYNMEKYLDKCISSLIVNDNSLMNYLDIIIVNDGSKDNSSNIAHNYSRQYPEVIRVIDKENGNYGSCINRGLSEAKGKYIKVLDADDTFDNGNWIKLIKELLSLDVDLVLTDYNLVDKKGNIICHKDFKFSQNECFSANMMVRELGEVEMHAITYKTQILKDMGYVQTEGISYTDTEWVFIPMQNVKTIYYAPITVYKYLVGREGQTMDENVYVKNRSHVKKILYSLLTESCKNNLLKSEKSIFFQHKLYGYCSRFYNLSLMDRRFNSSELIDVDKFIKDNCIDLYNYLSLLSYSNIKYIKIWRENNYNIPFYFRCAIDIIKLKRKYLSNIKLGWMK